jgi:DNA invertase Pin-like site-specific DNA recombinase
MTDRQPVAYIRRSAADADNPGDVSRDVQEHAIRELAHRDGFNGDVEYFVDWAKSAAEEKTEKRTAYAAMLHRIEGGTVSHVYAYALDRLNRSLVMTARFAKACEDNDVKIITKREGEVRQDTPSEWLRWTILATFGEFELRTIRERANASIARKRANNEKMGQAPYGYRSAIVDGRRTFVRDEGVDLDAVLDAYREAKSVLGACGLLEAKGIPAPKGGNRWATSALTRIIEANAPELLPQRREGGMRTPSRSLFTGLLRCPFCSKMLTPNTHRGQYYCSNGPRDRANHPRYTVREVDIRKWLEDEAAHLGVPGDALALEGIETRREAIEARLARASELYLAGDIDRPRFEAEKVKITGQLDALDRQGSVALLPTRIDFTKPPEKVNAALRAIWDHIELGPDLRPVSASWIVEEWRVDDPAPEPCPGPSSRRASDWPKGNALSGLDLPPIH